MKVENGTSSILYTFNEFELNQHEAEIRKPLEDKIHLLQEQLDLLNKLNKDTQELVIEEVLEWCEENKNIAHALYDVKNF